MNLFIQKAFADSVTLAPGLSTTAPSDTVGGWIQGFYNLALAVAGILAFGAIVYGGVRYAVGKGNPSSESEGRSWITNALLGLLLLAVAWIILYTVNPQILSLNIPGLPKIQTQPATAPVNQQAPPLGQAVCGDLQQVAKNNNEPYPAQTSPEITALISCLHQHVQFSAPQYTYDQSHSTCNYTRGLALCDSSCSHAAYSCHYGGHSGTQGALAVDIAAVGALGQQIVDAAYNSCGISQGGSYPKARCESADGVLAPCVNGGATHVHISANSCDAH